MSTSDYQIRDADAQDIETIVALLPQLADFNLPERRNPDDLWQADAELARKVAAGQTNGTAFLRVATSTQGDVLGLTLTSMREELMSHASSAHLEAIVVAPNARGMGLGRALLSDCEAQVRTRGAHSLSLHVFARNERAHALYKSYGFDSELIRAIKWFD